MICFTTILIISQTKTVSSFLPDSLFKHRQWNKHPLENPEKQTRARVLPLRTWDIKTPPNTLRALFSSSGEVDEFLHWLSIDVADCPWQYDSFIPPTPRPHRLQGSWSWFIGVPVCSRPPSPQKLMTAHNYAAAPEIYWRRFANRSWNAHEQNAQMVQELESPAGDLWEFGLMKKNDINGDPERLVYRCNENVVDLKT